MSINEKDLLELIALALYVGNGQDENKPFGKPSLHAIAIQVFKQSGFTREQVEEVINKI